MYRIQRTQKLDLGLGGKGSVNVFVLGCQHKQAGDSTDDGTHLVSKSFILSFGCHQLQFVKSQIY